MQASLSVTEPLKDLYVLQVLVVLRMHHTHNLVGSDSLSGTDIEANEAKLSACGD